MLVLSRKVGERILVGDDITITVVRLTNGGVRIGIDAPQEMPVLREEVVRDGVSAKKKKPKNRDLNRHHDRPVTVGASEE